MENTPLNQRTDEELAVLAVEDHQALAEIMSRYQGPLLAYIRRLSGLRDEDAEDILQESYIKAYVNLNDFDRKLKFSSWLYRIVHNETISEWRKRKARPSVILENDDWEKIKSGDDLHNEINARMDRARLEKAIDRLPEKYRDAIVLKYLEEKSYEEIADILRKPVNTIGTLISRAKKQLNHILETYAP